MTRWLCLPGGYPSRSNRTARRECSHPETLSTERGGSRRITIVTAPGAGCSVRGNLDPASGKKYRHCSSGGRSETASAVVQAAVGARNETFKGTLMDTDERKPPGEKLSFYS